MLDLRKTLSGLSRLFGRLIFYACVVLVAFLVILPFLLGTIDLFNSLESEIYEHHTRDGVEYFHKDELTTRIMNWVSGKDTLYVSDKESLVRCNIKTKLEDLGISRPEGFSDMRMEELKTFVQSMREPKLTSIVNKAEVRLSGRKRVSGKSIAPELNNVLWQMAKKVGSPKVRFPPESFCASFVMRKRGGVAFYTPYKNEIFINPLVGEPVDQLIAEFSHSKQRNDSGRMGYYFSLGKMSLVILSRTVMETVMSTPQVLADVYGATYSNPGDLEYEAHEVIEPEIREEFNDMISR